MDDQVLSDRLKAAAHYVSQFRIGVCVCVCVCGCVAGGGGLAYVSNPRSFGKQ